MLISGDIAILYASLFFALMIRSGRWPSRQLLESHMWPFLIINFLWLIIFYIAGLYDVEKSSSATKYLHIVKPLLFGIGIAIAIFYLVPFSITNITPKTNLLVHAAIASIALWLWRKLFQRLIVRGEKIKVFLGGDDLEIINFIDYLRLHPQLGYEPVNNQDTANIIIVSDSLKNDQTVIDRLYKAVARGKTVVDFNHFYESTTGKIPVSRLNKSWFLENVIEINKKSFEKSKRLLDIILCVFLMVPFIFIFPLIFLTIKFSSPGPIFYRQKRIGKNGAIFEIIKFRSMIDNAEKQGAVWATKNDCRITPVGNLLRRSRIDELPQIFNILKGEISFIGPRPERPGFVDELSEKIPHYQMRHIIKPGLSGWAQINFPYGSSIEDAIQKLQYDLYYVKNRSIILEITIFLKTIMTVLKIEGR